MTLLEVEELTSYFARHPPLHLLIAAYLGIGKDNHSGTMPNSREWRENERPDLGSVLSRIVPGLADGDVHTDLPPVILDFAELAARERESLHAVRGARG